MLARGVDRRPFISRTRRPANDPGIDEMSTGRCYDLADADRGLRADRVAVEIDRLAAERFQGRSQAAGELFGLARRKDREKEISAFEQPAFIGRRDHTGLPRALGA